MSWIQDLDASFEVEDYDKVNEVEEMTEKSLMHRVQLTAREQKLHNRTKPGRVLNNMLFFRPLLVLSHTVCFCKKL